ncbi:IS30 family transposase [Lactovum miscens]|uniref:IS30 family transposase n=1 Tax=Lactovum miscens TaxID=190387 RepID=A0A841C811_9LACT|nr:hypothetical protein [Lactovum miscens]MBB5887858.1 IS30 family transposase [Lactovum miscens]
MSISIPNYASFEGGSNENHKHMIRHFLSKGKKKTTASAVAKIETRTNCYPRKML